MTISGVGGGFNSQAVVRIPGERPDVSPVVGLPGGVPGGVSDSGSVAIKQSSVVTTPVEQLSAKSVSTERPTLVSALTERPRVADIATGGPRATPVFTDRPTTFKAPTERPGGVPSDGDAPIRQSLLGASAVGRNVQNAVVQQIQTNNTEMVGMLLDRFF